MANLSNTLVCFAVKEEAGHFRRWATNHSEIEVLVTGMGRYNAEKALQAALARQKPARVITAGFAGGLNPALAMGTVLFQSLELPDLAHRLEKAGARSGSFYASNVVLATADQKRAIHASTKADAVEMESIHICELCRKQNVPSAIVRVILDTAAEDMALNFNEVMTPDMQLDPFKLAWRLLKSPAKIPALIRLQSQSASCARRLADTLSRVLG